MTTVDETPTPSLLNELANDLRNLTAAEVCALSIRQAVAHLFRDIEAAIQRGNTLEAIAERFAERGLKTSVRTLETYLQRERHKRRRTQPKHPTGRDKIQLSKIGDKVVKLPMKGGETPPDLSPVGFLVIDEDTL